MTETLADINERLGVTAAVNDIAQAVMDLRTRLEGMGREIGMDRPEPWATYLTFTILNGAMDALAEDSATYLNDVALRVMNNE